MYGSHLERVEKAPMDFATNADIEAERVIVQLLRAARPADRLIGEESGVSFASGGAGREWLVDPICGTLNYAAQTPLVAVNVALRVRGQVTAAASADPFTQEIFWTNGTRAALRLHGHDEQLRPSPRSTLLDVNLDGPYPNAQTFRAVHVLADSSLTEMFRPRVTSTTLALTWVAAGRRSAYLTDGHLMDSVHFTSAIAICQAAGCIVTGLQGQPLHTGLEGLIAAADTRTHAALIKLVAKQLT